jgi:hypothetical protein
LALMITGDLEFNFKSVDNPVRGREHPSSEDFMRDEASPPRSAWE